MANTKIISNYKEDFKRALDENKGKFNFEVIGVNLIEKDKYKGDLSKLISCSKNYYEDLIKIYTNNEYVLEAEENTYMDISGSGLIYIIVKKNSTLNLNFEDDGLNAVYVKILVEENVSLNLVEFSNLKNLYKNIEVFLEKDARVNFAQFVFNSCMNMTEFILDEGSSSDINSFYYGNENKFYLLNKSTHIAPNSSSDITVRGACANGAEVISDGIVRIGQNAAKSKGFQDMKGLILDENSSISSEPILEIENNDVQCSHGSSISQVSEEILFYMQSRGISKTDAVKLVLEGFYMQIAESVSELDLRERIVKKIENSI